MLFGAPIPRFRSGSIGKNLEVAGWGEILREGAPLIWRSGVLPFPQKTWLPF